MTKKKNKENSKSDFIRYSANEMTDKERNAFEKDLQKDPFEAEATEGFELISADDAADDLQVLSSRLSKRFTARRSSVIYRIAAAVIVLVAISSVFLVRELRKPALLYSDNSELVKSASPEESMVKEQAGEKDEVSIPVSSLVETTSESEAATDEKEGRGENIITLAGEEVNAEYDLAGQEDAVRYRNEMGGVKVDEPAVRRVANENIDAEAKDDRYLSKKIKGKVLSADDSLPLPGVSIKVKGETITTTSAPDGTFFIQSDNSDTLVTNYLGMRSKEIPVTGDDIGDILIEPDMNSLDEPVVIEYALQGKAAGVKVEEVSDLELDKEFPGYISARPAIGMDDYMDYIEQEQVFPENYTESDRVVVRVKFKVLASGSISGIEIIKSQDEAFSKETIRLISKGPGWVPASLDGISLEETVRLRIVFRR